MLTWTNLLDLKHSTVCSQCMDICVWINHGCRQTEKDTLPVLCISIKRLVQNINKQLFPMNRFTCMDRIWMDGQDLWSDLFAFTSKAIVSGSLKKACPRKRHLRWGIILTFLCCWAKPVSQCVSIFTDPWWALYLCAITQHLIMKSRIRRENIHSAT